MVVGDDVALGIHDRAGALGLTVAGRHVDGDHGIGDFLGHGAPVDGLAGLRGGGTGAGGVGLDVGQRIRGRYADPTVGNRREADAKAQARGHQRRDDDGDDLTGMLGLGGLGEHTTLRPAGLAWLVRLVRRAERIAEWVAIVRGRRHAFAILPLRVQERVAVVLLRVALLVVIGIRVAEEGIAVLRRHLLSRRPLRLAVRAVLRLARCCVSVRAGLLCRLCRHRAVRAVFRRGAIRTVGRDLRSVRRRATDHRTFAGRCRVVRRHFRIVRRRRGRDVVLIGLVRIIQTIHRQRNRRLLVLRGLARFVGSLRLFRS